MSGYAPIVLFVYNRPQHAARALASLVANPLATESDLVIYADGPKKVEHVPSVEQTRAVARSAGGFKSVRMVERDSNWGLAKSIISGVTETCDAHGRVIVVEDDLVVAPPFLKFMNEGLDRYQADPRVFQVSAYSYPIDGNSIAAAYFLPMVSCWGWATWARAWQKFDPSMKALDALDTDVLARRRFNIDDSYDYYGMACDQRAGRIDSWGVRWQLSLFANDGVVLYPRNSLVFNAGTDSSGTHGAGQPTFQDVKAAHASFEKGEWPLPQAEKLALDRVKQLLTANRPGLIHRLVRRFRS